MAAKVEIIYEAEASSLKATINEVNKANDAIEASVKETSKVLSNSMKDVGKSFVNAFAGNEVRKSLDEQNKAFDNINKRGKTLTGQLRALKNELSQLEVSGKAGTAQFRQLTLEAARLEDQIGDTRARVANLAADTFKFDAAVQATQGLAAGFEIAQGAAALFGSESEDLQKALLKVQAATAIANGVQQVANLLLEESAIKTLIVTKGQAALALVTGTSTGALKAFRIALAATGVGLLVVGLIALIENFDKVKRALENSIPGFKEVSDAIGGVVDTIKDWVSTSDEADRAASAFDAAAKKQRAASDAAIERIERQIDIEKSLGRSTVALEIQREQAVINANRAIIADYAKKAGTLSQLSDEEKAKAKEVNDAAVKAVFDASAKIIVIRNEAAREAAEKAKEEAKKAAEAEKKEAEDLEKQRKELLDKRIKNNQRANEQIAASREADLQEELAAVAVAEDASFELKIQSLEKQKAIEIEAAETAGLLTYEIAKKYDALITEQKKQQAQAQLDAQINALKTLEINEGTSLDRRIELIELEAQKRIEAAKGNASEIALIEAETQASIRAERKKSTDEAVEDAFALASATADALGSILKFQSQLTENRIAEIESTSEKELEAINNSLDSEVTKANKREALEKRTQAKIAAEKQKQAKQEKALNIFNAIIDTAASIVKTGAQLGYPAAIPFQVLAGVIGAANVAAIAAQPLPKFKRGGMVGGKSHEAGGTLIEAERGEFVVNKDSVRRNRRELDAINTSSAAFKRLIEERYVRPAILNYAMNNKRDGITVNASLNSKSMERELKGLRKDMRNKNTIVNINGGDSRYSWQ